MSPHVSSPSRLLYQNGCFSFNLSNLSFTTGNLGFVSKHRFVPFSRSEHPTMFVLSRLCSSTKKACSSQMASNPSITIQGLSKFTSPKASEFFSLVSKRQFVPERRYILDDLYLSDMLCADALFTHYGLHKLNYISCRFNASVVHEFYSNFSHIHAHTKYHVSVRHVMVPVYPTVIDRFLEFLPCPNVSFDAFALAASKYTIS